MIPDYNPVTQALLGTLFTWAVTALGSALVFVFNSGQRRILDASLGFAAGVMLAASYWSLLAPAIEMAEISGSYGKDGKFAFIPVSVGFVLGAVFVYGADKLMPFLFERFPYFETRKEVQMIPDYNPVTQALLGTLFTWAVTALGSALVFVFNSGQRRILDASLGFAAGVMLAASYWSLLAPAIEMAEISGSYGKDGKFAFIPVSVGFVLGAVFVYGADKLMPFLGVESSNIAETLTGDFQNGSACKEKELKDDIQHTEVSITNFSYSRDTSHLTQRKRENFYTSKQEVDHEGQNSREQQASWRRILLLIIAITVHNIPEGLAVGVGFGAIGKTASATFENARNLAIGIGIQNFPEGLAVSLPLRGAGFSSWKSFWYGQLSGMVEPIAGLFGAVAVVVAEPLLPYALAFAAGAMIYVVVDDIIPEAQTSGNGHLASCTTIVGFVVMMSLDVGLG